MGDAEFTVIRGDDFQQPFTVTLDQSRTLDGGEGWTFSVRLNKTDAAALLTLTNPDGVTITAGTFQPVVVFTPSDFSSFTNFGDETYKYDLQMSKDGKIETVANDDLIITGDVTR